MELLKNKEENKPFDWEDKIAPYIDKSVLDD